MALKIAVRDMNGFPVTGVDILLSELQAKTVNSVASIKVGEQRKHCSLEVDLPWIVRYRLAIFFLFGIAGALYRTCISNLLHLLCMIFEY